MHKEAKTVYIIGPTFGIESHFSEYGYVPFTDYTIDQLSDKDPDFVAFMGGADINPDIYGQDLSSFTQHPNHNRDKREIELYWKYKHLQKIGVCRGAQLINALNGGSMYQHVNNHTGSSHPVTDYKGRTIKLCSVHHQMMVPAKNATMIAWASGVSTFREFDGVIEEGVKTDEPEVLFIPEDKALLFQAHPEFGPKSCTDYFFTLMEELF